MKFDLEAAKRGEPIRLVSDNNGFIDVTFVAHAPEAREHTRIVVVSESGVIILCGEDGVSGNHSLEMAPKKIKRWFNVYRHEEYGFDLGCRFFANAEEASTFGSEKTGYIKTISIEIEL